MQHPPEYRALMAYSELPAGCKVMPVSNGACHPHLRLGEFAVFDPSDRRPQHGELYVIGVRNIHDKLRCNIHQVRATTERDERYRKWRAWWYGPLKPDILPTKGHATEAAAMQAPLRFYLSEGPMLWTGIRQKILGRVIGIYQPVDTAADTAATTQSSSL